MVKKPFIKKNVEIIDHLEKFVDNNPQTRIVCTSSGAVNEFIKDGDKDKHLYGYLKLYEEQKLSKYEKCLALRIYGLTGYYIHSPHNYALSGFIFSALKNNNINIEAPGIVLRSYVSAETIIKLSFNWFFSSNEKGFVIDALKKQ